MTWFFRTAVGPSLAVGTTRRSIKAQQWIFVGWGTAGPTQVAQYVLNAMTSVVNEWGSQFPQQLIKTPIHHIYNVPTLDYTGYDIVNSVISCANSAPWSKNYSVFGAFFTAGGYTASAVQGALITDYQNDAYTR